MLLRVGEGKVVDRLQDCRNSAKPALHLPVEGTIDGWSQLQVLVNSTPLRSARPVPELNFELDPNAEIAFANFEQVFPWPGSVG